MVEIKYEVTIDEEGRQDSEIIVFSKYRIKRIQEKRPRNKISRLLSPRYVPVLISEFHDVWLFQRNLDQLEVLSKKLKAKTLRTEAPTQSIAATRYFYSCYPNVNLFKSDFLLLHYLFSNQEENTFYNSESFSLYLLAMKSYTQWIFVAVITYIWHAVSIIFQWDDCRLLAREGINAEQLARDLKSFELKVKIFSIFLLVNNFYFWCV